MDCIWHLGATYDPIIIKSDKMIHIYMKHIYIEFHRGNKIFKLIIIDKHIFLTEQLWTDLIKIW